MQTILIDLLLTLIKKNFYCDNFSILIPNSKQASIVLGESIFMLSI